MKGAERQTPRSEQNPVKYKIDNFGVNVFVFVWVFSQTHWGFGSTTRKIIRVWMFDKNKNEKQPPNLNIFPLIYVVNGFVFVWVISHAEVCTTRKIICVWTVRWRLKKHAPPPRKKVCTVTVCVSKVYDLNSDLFTILAFESSSRLAKKSSFKLSWEQEKFLTTLTEAFNVKSLFRTCHSVLWCKRTTEALFTWR